MPTSKLTSEGRITLPVEVRRALKMKPGDRVFFRTSRDGTVILEPLSVDLLSLKGSVRSTRKGVSVEAMQRAIRS